MKRWRHDNLVKDFYQLITRNVYVYDRIRSYAIVYGRRNVRPGYCENAIGSFCVIESCMAPLTIYEKKTSWRSKTAENKTELTNKSSQID